MIHNKVKRSIHLHFRFPAENHYLLSNRSSKGHTDFFSHVETDTLLQLDCKVTVSGLWTYSLDFCLLYDILIMDSIPVFSLSLDLCSLSFRLYFVVLLLVCFTQFTSCLCPVSCPCGCLHQFLMCFTCFQLPPPRLPCVYKCLCLPLSVHGRRTPPDSGRHTECFIFFGLWISPELKDTFFVLNFWVLLLQPNLRQKWICVTAFISVGHHNL